MLKSLWLLTLSNFPLGLIEEWKIQVGCRLLKTEIPNSQAVTDYRAAACLERGQTRLQVSACVCVKFPLFKWWPSCRHVEAPLIQVTTILLSHAKLPLHEQRARATAAHTNGAAHACMHPPTTHKELSLLLPCLAMKPKRLGTADLRDNYIGKVRIFPHISCLSHDVQVE